MKKITLFFFLLSFTFINAQNNDEKELIDEQFQQKIDSINNSFTFKEGNILLKDDIAEINVPEGYKFLDEKQSKYVLTDLWGNPPSEVLGLLFPKDTYPISNNFTYAVEVSFSKEGYINDDDAKDIDYDELLEQMQEDANAANEERKSLGYPSIKIIGWASEPFYDEQNKKLHWAKELSFEGDETNTLNYNIRVLGRRGFLNLNAIGTIDVLPDFKRDVDNILNSVSFTEGNKYSDFNPDLDEVAAYGLSGLIAGKILAKAGFFAILLKFWKVIVLAVAGGFGVFKKFFKRKEA